MIKPKKTKTGKWTAQVYLYTDENGRKIHPRVTADTKEDLLVEIALLKARKKSPKTGLTVAGAIDRYIEISEVLSPTTLSAYKKIREYAFQSIMDKRVDDLDDEDMQRAINSEAKRIGEQTGKPISPKTVKNEWGLLSSALRSVCNKAYNIKLPKIQHKNEDLPEPGEIYKAIQGSPAELPCLLAMWCSLSMSEIRGLTCESIKDGYLYIDQVMVEVDARDVVKDHAKTDARIRRVRVPDFIMSLINSSTAYKNFRETGENGPLIPMTRDMIYHHFTSRAKKAGLDLSFHDLRHVFASVMLTKLQIPEKIVQSEGGWSTDIVMKKVYSQGFSSSREEAARIRDEYFMNEISQIISQETR